MAKRPLNASLVDNEVQKSAKRLKLTPFLEMESNFLKKLIEKANLLKADCKDFMQIKRKFKLEAEISKLSDMNKKIPQLRLVDVGPNASLCLSDELRRPISFPDARVLLHKFLSPRLHNLLLQNWYKITCADKIKKIMFIIVEGVSIDTFRSVNLNKSKIAKYHSKMVHDGTLSHYSGDYDTQGSLAAAIPSMPSNSSADDATAATQVAANSNVWLSCRAWLPNTMSLVNTALEVIVPGSYGHTVPQDLFYTRYCGASIDPLKLKTNAKIKFSKKNLKDVPHTYKMRVPEHLVYQQYTGKEAACAASWDTATNTKTTVQAKEHDSDDDTTADETQIPSADRCLDYCQQFSKSQESPELSSVYYWHRASNSSEMKIQSEGDTFDRRCLLMTLQNMVSSGIPVPPGSKDPWTQTEIKQPFENLVATKDSYAQVRPSSPLFALDCEFYPPPSSVRLISIVNEAGDRVYYGRIALPDAEPNKKMISLANLQQDIRRCLPPDAILVGHGICADLSKIKMYHPYIIDTNAHFNLTLDGAMSSLKSLTFNLLGREIQKADKSHDPTVDATACLELIKLKLSKNYSFGNAAITRTLMTATVTDFKLKEEAMDDQGRIAFWNIWECHAKLLSSSSSNKDSDLKLKTDGAVAILSTAAHAEEWRVKLEEYPKGAPQHQLLNENDDIVTAACGGIDDNMVTIAHLEADPRMVSDKRKSQLLALASLDKQLSQMYEALPADSLFTVLFNNTADDPSLSSNGIMMLGLAGRERVLEDVV